MYAIARKRKAISSVKKRRKKATVDLSVQMSRIVVKINQPYNPLAKRRNKVKDVPRGRRRTSCGTQLEVHCLQPQAKRQFGNHRE